VVAAAPASGGETPLALVVQQDRNLSKTIEENCNKMVAQRTKGPVWSASVKRAACSCVVGSRRLAMLTKTGIEAETEAINGLRECVLFGNALSESN
jgi:hypothetical protein